MSARQPDACSAPFRVRFDEAGPDGRLRTSVLLRYAQDLAWYHSAQRGFDRAWYAERGLTWLVRAAEVAVLEPVQVGDEMTGTTRVIGWRRVWARRRTDFVDVDGTPIAWVHMHRRASRPISTRCSAPRTRPSPLAACRSGIPRPTPPPRPSPCGRRSSTRWTT